MIENPRLIWRLSALAVATLVLSVAMIAAPLAAAAQGASPRTADFPVTAQVIVLIVLVAVFVGAVLITPKIWHSNEPGKSADRKSEVDPP